MWVAHAHEDEEKGYISSLLLHEEAKKEQVDSRERVKT
jgi:hypothetical protein